MSKISRTSAAWAAIAAVVFSITGCGGRTMDDTGAPTDGTDPTDPTAPAPTCSEICRNAVDRCLPGANISNCASDCEKMRNQYQGCPGLEPFLRCMPKVPVICTPPDKVEFNGCNDERDNLVRCRS
jgi:hypothetical protein